MSTFTLNHSVALVRGAYLLDLLSQMPITRRIRSRNCGPWMIFLSLQPYKSRMSAISAPVPVLPLAARSGTLRIMETPRGRECRGGIHPPLKVRSPLTVKETFCKASPHYLRNPSRGLLVSLRAPSPIRMLLLVATLSPRLSNEPVLCTSTRPISCRLRTCYHRGLRSPTVARWRPPSLCPPRVPLARSSGVPRSFLHRLLRFRRLRACPHFHRRLSTTHRIR